ncbi:MAG: hypothetical protein HFG54_00530 [Lachnospiraceae bacterium]|jgi:hypothetical protein|nr:hypothetical protein [Lachnospiraceae bacterium]
MNQDLLCFFEKKPEALALYEVFEKKVLSEIENVHIKVQKTQISFANRYNFAFVSFLPVRKENRQKVYIVITFGLGYRVESPRIDGATEPYPNRWTHHVLISSEEEIDDELIGWVKLSSDFSARKR